MHGRGSSVVAKSMPFFGTTHGPLSHNCLTISVERVNWNPRICQAAAAAVNHRGWKNFLDNPRLGSLD